LGEGRRAPFGDHQGSPSNCPIGPERERSHPGSPYPRKGREQGYRIQMLPPKKKRGLGSTGCSRGKKLAGGNFPKISSGPVANRGRRGREREKSKKSKAKKTGIIERKRGGVSTRILRLVLPIHGGP